MELSQADEYAMQALGISREAFVATREKELERRKRSEPASIRAKADADGLSPEDIYALETFGISREDFLAARKKEKERRP